MEQMGLSRKRDIYALKALCRQKNRAQDSLDRENKKRKSVEEMIKGNKISKVYTSEYKSKCKFI